MNKQSEKLSSLLDDYRPAESDQAVLDDALADINQRYTLRRYQLIGDVMRNEAPDLIKPDFSAEVMARIEQEPGLQVETKTTHSPESKPSWLWSALFKPLAGVAVAATVAFVAVSSVQLQMKEHDSSDQVAQAESAVTNARVEQLASIPALSAQVKVSANGQRASQQSGMNWQIRRGEPAFQKKLNTYLINHNEFSNSMQGIIPQVRVVGFDAQK